MITGQHTPLDVGAGAAIAATELLILQFVARQRLGYLLDGVTGWTLRYRALSSAAVFALAFEMTSTMIHVRGFLGLGVSRERGKQNARHRRKAAKPAGVEDRTQTDTCPYGKFRRRKIAH